MPTNQPDHPDSDLPRGIGAPARRALLAAGYERVDQLTQISEAEIKQLHGVGPKAIGLLRQALAARGLAFVAGTKDGSDQQ